MARKKKSNDLATAQTLVVLVSLGFFLGWFEAARDFVLNRLPLFIALGVALLLLLCLVLRRLIVSARANRARQRVLDAQIASTDGMNGSEFERLVARLFQRDGYTNVRIPGGSGDLGADVMATAPDGSTIVIECKRYALNRSVSSTDMQKFLGTCFHEHGADHAWFVTTTRFSEAAHDLGTRRGVTLVDRGALAEWMARGTSVTSPATNVPGAHTSDCARGLNAPRTHRSSTAATRPE